MSKFGDRLAAALRARGMSQRELARRVGIQASWLNKRINSEREPKFDLELYLRIARELNIDPLDLVSEEWRDAVQRASEVHAGTASMGRRADIPNNVGRGLPPGDIGQRMLFILRKLSFTLSGMARELDDEVSQLEAELMRPPDRDKRGKL